MMALQTKPDFERCMKRVEAWFEGDLLDRPPVRFGAHNVQYNTISAEASRWPDLRARWFDAEYQVDRHLAGLADHAFHGETFPLFWPNLGPEIYAAFFGGQLEFGEVTSWSHPLIDNIENEAQTAALHFSEDNTYYRKLREMTRIARDKCAGKSLVGVTSWCPSIDCVAAWRGPQNLCMDLLTNPEEVKRLLDKSVAPFRKLAAEFHADLSAAGQPSVGWLGIPSLMQAHIPQADFSNMISPAAFDEFCLPWLVREMDGIPRHIFHMDGKGVAMHLDRLLARPEIQAIQWAQGVGHDMPIMQWIPLIQKIQASGKGVIVDLQLDELEPFIAAVRPERLYLCVTAPEAVQPAVLRRMEKWWKNG